MKEKSLAEQEIQLERENQDPGTFGKRGRLLFFLAILCLVFLAGNYLYGRVYLHSRHDRSYCVECHQFSAPASMWDVSNKHSEGLTCVQCHGNLPEGQGRCGSFSAHADVVNPNCISCHPSILKGSPIEKIVGVRLPSTADLQGGPKEYHWRLEDLMYRWHVNNKVCLCTDCHRNISHDKAVDSAGRYQPSMAYCKECHYHAVKDNYVKVAPLPELEVKEVQKP